MLKSLLFACVTAGITLKCINDLEMDEVAIAAAEGPPVKGAGNRLSCYVEGQTGPNGDYSCGPCLGESRVCGGVFLNVDLVICDGPPGRMPGGRFGLMPVMSGRFTQDCVILLNDTHREAEQRIMEFLSNFRSLKVKRLGHFSSYAEVVCSRWPGQSGKCDVSHPDLVE